MRTSVFVLLFSIFCSATYAASATTAATTYVAGAWSAGVGNQTVITGMPDYTGDRLFNCLVFGVASTAAPAAQVRRITFTDSVTGGLLFSLYIGLGSANNWTFSQCNLNIRIPMGHGYQVGFDAPVAGALESVSFSAAYL